MGARINKLRNFTAAMLTALGFVAFTGMFVIGSIWEANAAHAHDPAHGVVLHMFGNSHRFYTAFQTTATALSIWAFGIGVAAAFLITPLQPETGWRRITRHRHADDPYRVGRWGGLLGLALALLGFFAVGAPLIRWLNATGVVLQP